MPRLALLTEQAEQLCTRLHVAWYRVQGTGYPERTRRLKQLLERACERQSRRDRKCLDATGRTALEWRCLAKSPWRRPLNMQPPAALMKQLLR